MKKFVILASVACGLIAGPASATIVEIDFTGILLTTTDKTGTVFRNGTADNSGAGTEVTGHVVWDFSLGGVFGPHNYSNYFERDYSFSAASQSAFRWEIDVGGSRYNSDLNDGSHNVATLTDNLATANDSFGASLKAFGHYQITPTTNGAFDYLSVERRIAFNLVDSTGATVDGLDFAQPLNWVSGTNGFGTGSLSLISQIWEDGGDRPYSGTASTFLTDATGTFVLTSLRSMQVPEPNALTMLGVGLAVLFLNRRRRIRAV